MAPRLLALALEASRIFQLERVERRLIRRAETTRSTA